MIEALAPESMTYPMVDIDCEDIHALMLQTIQTCGHRTTNTLTPGVLRLQVYT